MDTVEAPLGGEAPFQGGKANGASKGVDAALDRPLPAVRASVGRAADTVAAALPRPAPRHASVGARACVRACGGRRGGSPRAGRVVRVVMRLFSAVVRLDAAAASSDALLLCRGGPAAAHASGRARPCRVEGWRLGQASGRGRPPSQQPDTRRRTPGSEHSRSTPAAALCHLGIEFQEPIVGPRGRVLPVAITLEERHCLAGATGGLRIRGPTLSFESPMVPNICTKNQKSELSVPDTSGLRPPARPYPASRLQTSTACRVGWKSLAAQSTQLFNQSHHHDLGKRQEEEVPSAIKHDVHCPSRDGKRNGADRLWSLQDSLETCRAQQRPSRTVNCQQRMLNSSSRALACFFEEYWLA